ncbi:hypothetical protein BGX38DRAFT_178976 [Terfezia claveryi]|nr:hypothetical protein BGX38DRAFT_178976 [Terfezia claveryi]
MPRLTRKKKACRAATYASQLAAHRYQQKRTEVPELEELKELEELEDADIEEELEDSDIEEELETLDQEELETLDQELIMEADAFAKLKASVIENSTVPTIKYYRGSQQSRQTIWRDKKRKLDLQMAATGAALITEYFKNPNTSSSEVPSDLREASPYQTTSDLSVQPAVAGAVDFQAQRGSLQEGIEARGHLVLFYPKFHCELNFIEFFWAAAKRHARENCEYSLQGLRDTIPLSLNSVSELTIWRFYNKCQRTMNAYRDGCQYGTAEFKERVYKSHRRKLA